MKINIVTWRMGARADLKELEKTNENNWRNSMKLTSRIKINNSVKVTSMIIMPLQIVFLTIIMSYRQS